MTADAKIGSEPTVDGAGGPDDRRPLTWRDVRGTPGGADELVCTASEAVALELVPAT